VRIGLSDSERANKGIGALEKGKKQGRKEKRDGQLRGFRRTAVIRGKIRERWVEDTVKKPTPSFP